MLISNSCSQVSCFKIPRSFSRDSNDYTAVDSTLSYSCHCIFLSKLQLKELDKLQANVIKVVLGLSKYCHTTHLMQAVRIKPISPHYPNSVIGLTRTCILSNSKTKEFCSHLYQIRQTKSVRKTLISRVHTFATKNNIANIFINEYRISVKKMLVAHTTNGHNGIVDSIRYLLKSYNPVNHDIIQMLLKPF